MTKDDEALGHLRDHVRAERAHDADLERIARGEADVVVSGGDDAEAMAKASAPLGQAFEDAVVAKVAPAPARPARVAILRRIGPYVGPVALAAAVLLYVTTRGAGGGDEGPVLPEYAATVRGDQVTRAPAAGDGRLRVTGDASSFEIVVRPAAAPTGRVAAWVFAREGDEEPTPLQADVEVSAEGSVRIRGTGASLAGARELRVVVAPAGRTKFDDAAARARTGTTDPHVRVLTVPIDRAAR